MNHFSEQSGNFEHLLDALIDGVLTNEQHDELAQLLRRDPAAREEYASYFALHAILKLEHVRPIVPFEKSPAAKNPVRSVVVGAVRGAANSPLVSTLIVALALYGCFGLLASNLRSGKLSTGTSLDDSIAVITNVADAQWASQVIPKSDHSPIRRSELLKIDSGVVELHLKRGAKLLVEGPAEWSIDGDNSATLQSGKLVAHVPKPATGFTVNTSLIQIVDLGTEFGVQSDVSGQAKVEVFTGKVDVNYSSTVGEVQAARRTVRMSAGQAKQFSKRDVGAEVTVIDTHPEMKNWAVKTLPTNARQELESDAASQRYADAVLADRPLAYWRLNDGSSGIAKDASGHGFNGSYNGGMRTNPSGLWPNSHDRCARFLGRESSGWLEMKDVEIPASYSAELWVRSESPVWQTDGWFLSSRAARGLILSPILNTRTWLFSIGDEAAAQNGISAHTPDKIDDRFHHYVGTFDALTGRGCMYFDGRLVTEGQPIPRDKLSREPRKLTLYIGRDEFYGRGWADGLGWVDEVAIYPTVLSADAIRRHFEAGLAPNTESESHHE